MCVSGLFLFGYVSVFKYYKYAKSLTIARLTKVSNNIFRHDVAEVIEYIITELSLVFPTWVFSCVRARTYARLTLFLIAKQKPLYD